MRRTLLLILAASAALLVACGNDEPAAPAAASSPETTAATAMPSTTWTPPPLQVYLDCYTDASLSQQQTYTMEVGDADFTAFWSANLYSCEATRDFGPLTPLEQQAVTAAGYPDETSVKTLYGMCTPSAHSAYTSTPAAAPGQIAEINGMLTLCPGHPLAAALQESAARGQAEAEAAAAGELFYAGTFLVGSQVQPGTYVIEGEIKNCYWERTDASGEIIDNNFVVGAQRVEVTIRSTDYSFHNEGCGKWQKVG